MRTGRPSCLRVWCCLGPALALAVACSARPVPKGVVEIPSAKPSEISGVAAVPGGFAVVGDETGDHGRIWPGGGRFEIEPELEGPEAIDVVVPPAGGAVWLILDEPEGRLIDLKAGRFEFPEAFKEVCGRGLEGLAARWQGGQVQVAALWEGGFFNPGAEPRKECKKKRGEHRRPLVALLDWKPGKGAASPLVTFELAVPELADGERFRATGLVWDGDGFLVLLRSTNAEDNRFSHTWLQRFDLDGEPVGTPLKLEEEWGAYCDGKNWEALDRTLDGGKLVMGYDRRGASELVIFVPP